MRGYRPDRSGGPWTSFMVAVLFLLVFPLFPLGAELLFTQQITMASLMLMTATYATSLSMSSQHVGRWAIGLTVGSCSPRSSGGAWDEVTAAWARRSACSRAPSRTRAGSCSR